MRMKKVKIILRGVDTITNWSYGNPTARHHRHDDDPMTLMTKCSRMASQWSFWLFSSISPRIFHSRLIFLIHSNFIQFCSKIKFKIWNRIFTPWLLKEPTWGIGDSFEDLEAASIDAKENEEDTADALANEETRLDTSRDVESSVSPERTLEVRCIFFQNWTRVERSRRVELCMFSSIVPRESSNLWNLKKFELSILIFMFCFSNRLSQQTTKGRACWIPVADDWVNPMPSTASAAVLRADLRLAMRPEGSRLQVRALEFQVFGKFDKRTQICKEFSFIRW